MRNSRNKLYEKYAEELVRSMIDLKKNKPYRNMNNSLQGETFLLHYIYEHGGEVLPGEISSEMAVSTARVAVALNRLEEKGFITRQMDSSDRRKILVMITEDGRKFAAQHHQAVIENTARLLMKLNEQDAEAYINITKRLVEATSDGFNEGDGNE